MKYVTHMGSTTYLLDDEHSSDYVRFTVENSDGKKDTFIPKKLLRQYVISHAQAILALLMDKVMT